MSIANPKDKAKTSRQIVEPREGHCKPMFYNYGENTFKDMKRNLKPKTTLLKLQKMGYLKALSRNQPTQDNTQKFGKILMNR